MTLTRFFVSVVLLLASFVSVVHASDSERVQLVIDRGRVWLTARDADVSDLLAEWTRIGGTSFTNRERLAGHRLTVELVGVTEAEALDVLLRSASGFVAARRDAVSVPGQSQFARITIVATSQAPATTASMATFAQAPITLPPPIPIAPGVRRLVGADGQPLPDDQEDASPIVVGPAGIPPGFDSPPQAGRRRPQ